VSRGGASGLHTLYRYSFAAGRDALGRGREEVDGSACFSCLLKNAPPSALAAALRSLRSAPTPPQTREEGDSAAPRRTFRAWRRAAHGGGRAGAISFSAPLGSGRLSSHAGGREDVGGGGYALSLSTASTNLSICTF